VFQPNSCQGDVFEEISQVVQSTLDGYRVCIFAYGQTGSGKTFTMEGPEEADENTRGMIPRAVEHIFMASQKLKEKGWHYDLEASFLEIYNEAIKDLLVSKSDKEISYNIKHDNKGTTVVTNLTSVKVTEREQVSSLLKRAAKNRAVESTKCSERSSRSYSVFILKLTGQNEISNQKTEGILNLIDLAGSECLNKSGSTGDPLEETQAINTSLSSLGDVIISLANKDKHVPYRNSILTYLLQNSLGGNSSKIMAFVNVSPLPSHMNETLCSLRLATKVNACDIGVATRKKNQIN